MPGRETRSSEGAEVSFFPDVIESEVVVDGATVRVFESSSDATTPTIVLVHGAGGSTQGHFWALFPMLAFEHRVVGLDLAPPGDGSELTLDTYVRQVEAVVERVRDDRGVMLVGYSLGSAVAITVAARRPDLIDSLVSVGGWLKADRSLLLYNDLWHELDAEGSQAAMAYFRLFASYGPGWLSSRSEADFLELKARAAQVGQPGAGRPVMGLMRAVDIVAEAESITQPTLVIACTFDRAAHPRLAWEIFGAISDARFAEVQSGHAVMQERPAEVFSLIEGFAADRHRYPAGTTIPQTDW